MSQTTPAAPYNKATSPDGKMKVELVVNEIAEAFVFHDRPFEKELSWLEYDLDQHRLDFIMDDGDMRDFGLPVNPELEKYLQNSFQVLVVLMDMEEKKEVAKTYYPLILHRA